MLRCALQERLREGERGEESISVRLNALGDRLIIQRTNLNGTVEDEAYCMIQFSSTDENRGETDMEDEREREKQGRECEHHAVIKCDDKIFRERISHALKILI